MIEDLKKRAKALVRRALPWLLLQMQEPSTWRGAALALGALGFALSEEQKELFAMVGMGLAGFIGVVSSDRKAINRAEKKIAEDPMYSPCCDEGEN